MDRRSYVMRIMKCTTCQNLMTVAKHCGKVTAKGHIKTMWCPYCKAIKDFEQIDLK